MTPTDRWGRPVLAECGRGTSVKTTRLLTIATPLGPISEALPVET